MRVIHLGTRVVSHFGLLDDTGNVTQTLDVSGSLNAIDNNSLLMLGAQLNAKWQELQAEHSPQNLPVMDVTE